MRYVFVFAACALLFFLVYQTQPEQIQETQQQAEQELMPEEAVIDASSPEPPKPNEREISNSINQSADFLSLVIGDQFRLVGQDDKSNRNLDVVVNMLDEQPKYTQIHGKIIGGGIAIITVGGGSTNIFLKTDTGIFEFAGPDFDGQVPRLKDVNWGDDVYRTPEPKVLPPDKPPIRVRLLEP
tara:strand:- start:231 stop:779 length:549 start_codon:yes stop_codon:yes gene_type:complete